MIHYIYDKPTERNPSINDWHLQYYDSLDVNQAMEQRAQFHHSAFPRDPEFALIKVIVISPLSRRTGILGRRMF